MPSIGNTTFKGRSGRQYRFKVVPLGTRFRKLSGVYVVANIRGGGEFGHNGCGVEGRNGHAAGEFDGAFG